MNRASTSPRNTMGMFGEELCKGLFPTGSLPRAEHLLQNDVTIGTSPMGSQDHAFESGVDGVECAHRSRAGRRNGGNVWKFSTVVTVVRNLLLPRALVTP